MTGTVPRIRATDIAKRYGPTVALAGVSLDVDDGDSLAIMGPSGSGKTTLLHVLAGIIRPDRGTVRLRTKSSVVDVTGLDDEERSALRLAELGFVFQQGLLIPELTALENVALPLLLAGISRSAADPRAQRVLDELGLHGLGERRIGQLLRRPGSAGRDRASHRHGSAHRVRGRADRRAGQPDGGRGDGCAARCHVRQGPVARRRHARRRRRRPLLTRRAGPRRADHRTRHRTSDRPRHRAGQRSRGGVVVMRWSAVWLLVRPARTGLSAVLLPVVTFAIMTAAVLSTAVVATLSWQVPDDAATYRGGYKVLAAVLVTLLVVPLSTIAASAARLSARRRDDRLATLRLLGATTTWVRLVAVTEATLVAAVGVVLGVVVHLASAPLLTFFPLRGETPPIERVWLTGWVIAVVALGVVMIAVLSAVTGLRQVVISPLGVRARTGAPRLSWARAVVGGVVIAGAVGLVQMVSADWGVVGVTAAFAVAVVAVMAVLGVIGPFVIGRLAARRARRAGTAAELIAARGILESPKAAWRQVSGVALASFLVVPTGSVLGYLDVIARSSTVLDAEISQIFVDVRTVMLAALILTFVLVACSIGVTQAAAVIERREALCEPGPDRDAGGGDEPGATARCRVAAADRRVRLGRRRRAARLHVRPHHDRHGTAVHGRRGDGARRWRSDGASGDRRDDPGPRGRARTSRPLALSPPQGRWA
ncbi:ATP-binding cassette domain-containing protein [Salana multivorans]